MSMIIVLIASVRLTSGNITEFLHVLLSLSDTAPRHPAPVRIPGIHAK